MPERDPARRLFTVVGPSMANKGSSESLQEGTSSFPAFPFSSPEPDSGTEPVHVGVWIGLGAFVGLGLLGLVIILLYFRCCCARADEATYAANGTGCCPWKLLRGNQRANRPATGNFVSRWFRSLLPEPTVARSAVYIPGGPPYLSGSARSQAAERPPKRYRYGNLSRRNEQSEAFIEVRMSDDPSSQAEDTDRFLDVQKGPQHPDAARGSLSQHDENERSNVRLEDYYRPIRESSDPDEQRRRRLERCRPRTTSLQEQRPQALPYLKPKENHVQAPKYLKPKENHVQRKPAKPPLKLTDSLRQYHQTDPTLELRDSRRQPQRADPSPELTDSRIQHQRGNPSVTLKLYHRQQSALPSDPSGQSEETEGPCPVQECPLHPDEPCGCMLQQARAEIHAAAQQEEYHRLLHKSIEYEEQRQLQQTTLTLELIPFEGTGAGSDSLGLLAEPTPDTGVGTTSCIAPTVEQAAHGLSLPKERSPRADPTFSGASSSNTEPSSPDSFEESLGDFTLKPLETLRGSILTPLYSEVGASYPTTVPATSHTKHSEHSLSTLLDAVLQQFSSVVESLNSQEVLPTVDESPGYNLPGVPVPFSQASNSDSYPLQFSDSIVPAPSPGLTTPVMFSPDTNPPSDSTVPAPPPDLSVSGMLSSDLNPSSDSIILAPSPEVTTSVMSSSDSNSAGALVPQPPGEMPPSMPEAPGASISTVILSTPSDLPKVPSSVSGLPTAFVPCEILSPPGSDLPQVPSSVSEPPGASVPCETLSPVPSLPEESLLAVPPSEPSSAEATVSVTSTSPSKPKTTGPSSSGLSSPSPPLPSHPQSSSHADQSGNLSDEEYHSMHENSSGDVSPEEHEYYSADELRE